VLLPGFVNAHHHVGMTPVQLGSPDMPLELWFITRLVMKRVDPYLDTLYSALRWPASSFDNSPSSFWKSAARMVLTRPHDPTSRLVPHKPPPIRPFHGQREQSHSFRQCSHSNKSFKSARLNTSVRHPPGRRVWRVSLCDGQ